MERIAKYEKYKDRLVIDWITHIGWCHSYGEVKAKEVIKLSQIGRLEAQSFRLYERYKIDTIPDGRGVFIRGINLGRSSDFGDIDTAKVLALFRQMH